MSAILRIDVDKPFLMWGSAPRPRKPSRGLKKSFSKRTFLPSVKNLTKNIPLAFSFSTNLFLGRKALPKETYSFLAQVLSLERKCFVKKKKCMIKDLNSRGIKASLFFQPFTVPNEDFAQKLVKVGHSVGLHAVHTKDFKVFSRDLNKISKRFNGNVYGFTKHSLVINYDDSERLSGHINSGFVINNALRRVCLWKYFL